MTDQKNKNHHNCACCTKADYEFPDELLTPELLEIKKIMSKEEFETFMKNVL